MNTLNFVVLFVLLFSFQLVCSTKTRINSILERSLREKRNLNNGIRTLSNKNFLPPYNGIKALSGYGSTYGQAPVQTVSSYGQSQQLPVNIPTQSSTGYGQAVVAPTQSSSSYAQSVVTPAVTQSSSYGQSAPSTTFLTQSSNSYGQQAPVQSSSGYGQAVVAPAQSSGTYGQSYQQSVPTLSPMQSYYNSQPAIQQLITQMVNQYHGNQLSLAQEPPNTCSIGFVQPIYESDQISETYCRCPSGTYGFTCTENFANPCLDGTTQYSPADSRVPPNYFIKCSWGIPYLHKCPYGTSHWNQELYTCVADGSYSSNSGTFSSNYGSSGYGY